MSDTTEVHFRYAGEVRLDFPELDLAVILKGRLKAELGPRLPVRAYMLKGDVWQLLHGKFQTNVALGHAYGGAIQSTTPYSPKFGTQAVEPLEIKEVRTLSKECKHPPDDWLFGWVCYSEDTATVRIVLRDGRVIILGMALPKDILTFPKYCHVNPELLEALSNDPQGGYLNTDRIGDKIHFSHICLPHSPAKADKFVANRFGYSKTRAILFASAKEAEGKAHLAMDFMQEETKGAGYKQDAGKLDYNLLMRDMAPQVEQIVKVLHWGHHTKGYPRNGFRTLPDAEGRFMAATQRHLAAMSKDALAKDEESGLPHAIHVIANQLMMLAVLEGK